ncbi:MAG: acyl-CoA dehydrogenase family protein [Microthrixaceae bacterium]
MSPSGEARDEPREARDELRSWLAEHLPATRRRDLQEAERSRSLDELRAWNAELFDGGWAAPSWPRRFGGRDAEMADQLAFHEEMAAARALGPVNKIGVSNIAPAIMTYGTEAQQERFLRPMLRGDELWCQGMSEPEAGSDLASLRCRAEVDGDDFVVSGQKTWNSNGDVAHWCQLYVRTDPDAPKRKGITALLVDMSSPGIEVRPIRTMAGDHDFAEVFFDGVRVPRSAILGEVNEGWAVATRTLSNERAGVAVLYLRLRRKYDALARSVAEHDLPGDPALRRQALAARYVDVRVVEMLAKRTLGAMMAGRAPGAEGSVIKIAWSKTDQALAETASSLLGMAALEAPWARDIAASRSLSIAGGTTEVNKNIVGERVLGLPREPSA